MTDRAYDLDNETGCGMEIACECINSGRVPVLIRDNGMTGDSRIAVYDCDGVEAICTNGGALWQGLYDRDEWRKMVSSIDD